MPVTAPGPDRPAPAPLVVAASLTAVEALVLALLGVLELASIRLDRLTMGATTAVFFIVAAAGLAWCAWCLWHCRRWARSPVVMTQLICLGLAWNFWGGQTRPISVGLAITALVVVAGLLHRETSEVLEEDSR